MTDGILNLLRAGTGEAHTRLEQYVDMPKRAADPERYVGLIECFYGWYEPMERLLAAVGNWEGTGFAPEERAKASWLENDLRALGKTTDEIAALPRCAALPSVDSLPRGFGCAYVMEGATLGGRVITGLLEGHVPAEARRFFRSYGEAVRERWLQFTTALEEFAKTHGGQESIVEAATESFRSLEAWMRYCDENRDSRTRCGEVKK